jgi:hypothetical protein
MLRAKERRQLKSGLPAKNVGYMPEIGQHRRLITDKSNTLSADQIDLVIKQAFDTESYPRIVHNK